MKRDVDKRPLLALLGACVALLILLGVGLVAPAPAGLAPTPHPSFAPMLSSGAAAPGGGWVLVAGFAVGVLIVVMIGMCLLIGVRRTAKSLRRWVVAGTVAYAFVFGALMLSYLDFLGEGPIEIFGGLPVPSAWMMYGVWLFPWIFIIALVATFDDVYFPPESETRFREILSAKEKR